MELKEDVLLDDMEVTETDKYGVWDFTRKVFESNVNLDYSTALGLALFCCENDDAGPKNFAVIAMDQKRKPIWHEMVWCGQFQGYKWLYEECVRLGEINERDEEDIKYL